MVPAPGFRLRPPPPVEYLRSRAEEPRAKEPHLARGETKADLELALTWLLSQKRDLHKLLAFAAATAVRPATHSLWQTAADQEAGALAHLEAAFGSFATRRGWTAWWQWWACPEAAMWQVAGSLVAAPGFPIKADLTSGPSEDILVGILMAKAELARRLEFLAGVADGPRTAGLLHAFAEQERRDRDNLMDILGAGHDDLPEPRLEGIPPPGMGIGDGPFVMQRF